MPLRRRDPNRERTRHRPALDAVPGWEPSPLLHARSVEALLAAFRGGREEATINGWRFHALPAEKERAAKATDKRRKDAA